MDVTLDPLRRIVVTLCFFAAALAAQPPTPKFDVISIRTVQPNAPPVMRDRDFTPILPGGQFIDSRVNLGRLIAIAWGVKFPDRQLLGLPNWAKSQAYAVSAKPAEGFPALSPVENIEQVRLMMKSMLADRFHLQLHTETRQERIFNLEVAKGGIRLKQVDPPVPPEIEEPVGLAMGDDGGRMIGHKSTVSGIARALTILLPQPVIDQTGLKGYYDFNEKWTAPAPPEGQPPAAGLGTEGVGLLISALESQFGLRLTNATGPVEYWVVDHVEPPAGN